MGKVLKVIGYTGLLTGVIVIAKKIHPTLCREAAETFHDVENKVEHVVEEVEHAVRYRYKAHAGPFTDVEKMKKLQEARDAFVALLSVKESNDVPESINEVENPENDEWTFVLGDKIKVQNGATFTIVKRSHPTFGQQAYCWLGDNGQEMELTDEDEATRGIVPFSDEYKVIINSAYAESLKDENFKLKFFGSTYGIGTKGQESEDGSKAFAKDDIAKLKKKLK